MPQSGDQHAAAHSARGSRGPRRIPEGYVPVPISVEMAKAALRVCVLVRRQAEPVGGHLVVLRDTFDARVVLGALCDALGAVHEWLEVWVQTVDGLAAGGGASAARHTLSNAALDDRWAIMCDAWAIGREGTPIRTGWESGGARPRPTWIDPAKMRPVHPGARDADDESGGAEWKLCVDDAALTGAGLPPYGTSRHRYLTDGSSFVPVTRGAPTTDRCRGLAGLVGGADVALIPEGGRVMVRRLAPMAFEPFAAFLGDPRSGELRFGVPHGRGLVALDDAAEREADEPAGAFVLDHLGSNSRLIELLFLKLRLMADAVGAVRTQVAATGRPLLNVRPESFRVRLSGQARGLPRLWSARAELVDPGEAIALPVRAIEAVYFVPGALSAAGAGAGTGGAASIFRTEAMADAAGHAGTGQLRIRQILTHGSDETILEGTLTSHERMRAAKNDLVSLRVGLGAGRVELFGRVQSDTAMASGEMRLRTLPQRLTAAEVAGLKAAEGVPLSGVSFEVIPLLSTPCDLYSLGVVAVRTFLVGGGKDRGNTLAVALDEMMSLSRELAAGWNQNEPAWRRVGGIFASDRRWFDVLGPQRMVTGETLTPEQALALVPGDIWFRLLAMIASMFPGLGRDSVCADFGDAKPAGLQLVFDPTLAALDDLLVRTRSLIVVDWKQNREVHAVLRRFATGVAGVSGGVGGAGSGGRNG